MTTKEVLHHLIDELADDDLPAAEQLLGSLRKRSQDPLRRALRDAAVDDEVETEEEQEAVQVARAEVARGEAISDEDLWRRLRDTPVR